MHIRKESGGYPQRRYPARYGTRGKASGTGARACLAELARFFAHEARRRVLADAVSGALTCTFVMLGAEDWLAYLAEGLLRIRIRTGQARSAGVLKSVSRPPSGWRTARTMDDGGGHGPVGSACCERVCATVQQIPGPCAGLMSVGAYDAVISHTH